METIDCMGVRGLSLVGGRDSLVDYPKLPGQRDSLSTVGRIAYT